MYNQGKAVPDAAILSLLMMAAAFACISGNGYDREAELQAIEAGLAAIRLGPSDRAETGRLLAIA